MAVSPRGDRLGGHNHVVAQGFRDHAALYAVVVAGYTAAFAFLTLVLKTGMGLGVAYDIWGVTSAAATPLDRGSPPASVPRWISITGAVGDSDMSSMAWLFVAASVSVRGDGSKAE